jgi:hypothetical protein
MAPVGGSRRRLTQVPSGDGLDVSIEDALQAVDQQISEGLQVASERGSVYSLLIIVLVTLTGSCGFSAIESEREDADIHSAVGSMLDYKTRYSVSDDDFQALIDLAGTPIVQSRSCLRVAPNETAWLPAAAASAVLAESGSWDSIGESSWELTGESSSNSWGFMEEEGPLLVEEAVCDTHAAAAVVAGGGWCPAGCDMSVEWSASAERSFGALNFDTILFAWCGKHLF